MSVGYVSQEKRLVRLTYQPQYISLTTNQHQLLGVSENPDKIPEHVREQ
jgi:hypothetical protein